MKKIAMLTCLKSVSSVCTGAGCFSALNNRSGAFERYATDELQVSAFFQCNGCEHPLGDNDGLKEKVLRIIKLSPDAVHVGICTKKRESSEYCAIIIDILEELKAHHIPIVFGTH